MVTKVHTKKLIARVRLVHQQNEHTLLSTKSSFQTQTSDPVCPGGFSDPRRLGCSEAFDEMDLLK